VAVGLAAALPGSIVLVDLDVQFGDVASALALGPEYTLPDTVHGAATNDPLVLKTFLSRHSTGLHVVAGSDSPAAGDAVTPADVGRLVDMLSREFRYVVVDTAPGLTDHTLTALERATDLVMRGSMGVPGVRGLRKELDVLGELGLVPARRHLVLNNSDGGSSGLDLADVEQTVGAPLELVLPRHSTVPLSTNTGAPLLQKGGKDPVTRGLQTLVGRIPPVAAPVRGRLTSTTPGLAMLTVAGRAAYEALATRTQVADLRRFVGAVNQAEAYGIPLADVLRAQADEMRVKRRQRAEEQAMKVPVEVTFPLMVCVLPALLIIVVGPAAMGVLESLG
jgi:Flp pilus assembly CpaE family ATPase